MQFVCEQDILFKKISHAKDVSSSKDFNYSLVNILLYAKEEYLHILSTNVDLLYHSKIKVDIQEEGFCLIHSQKLYEILKNFPNAPIKFKTRDNNIDINSTDKNFKRRFCIYKSNAENYPIKTEEFSKDFIELENENENTIFEIELKDLLKAIKKTIHISNKDELRPFLNGLLLEKEEKKWNYVATDGKKLAYLELEEEKKLDIPNFKIIIPYKTLNELQKILKEQLKEIEKKDQKKICKISISKKKDKILFTIKNNKLLSVLIIGNYPNYKEVIPKNPELIILVDRLKLMESIISLAIMADQNLLRILLKINGNLLILGSKSDDFGFSEDQLNIQRIKGDDDVEIAFNYVSILDFLRQIESDKLEIHICDYRSPTLFRGINDINFYFVVAPMKID